MSHREFNHLSSSLNALSPDQSGIQRRELKSNVASSNSRTHTKQTTPAEETAFDRLESAGLIGHVKGVPAMPTDLGTNPIHMEAVARD